jgi:nucleotide-binding universal stress UspA family protein
MKLLVAIDESEHATRMMEYLGHLLGQSDNIRVTLFHVLKPMPRKLLEHGGSEDPDSEAQRQAELRDEQRTWLRTQREAECQYLLRAREVLVKTGMAADKVELKFGYEDDIARNILEEARTGGYGTVVLGHSPHSGMKHLFGGGVAERLLRDASGLAVWIVP